ncbi:MAG: hypothetical protein AAFU85_15350 [Planctomycetota bacterium]
MNIDRRVANDALRVAGHFTHGWMSVLRVRFLDGLIDFGKEQGANVGCDTPHH